MWIDMLLGKKEAEQPAAEAVEARQGAPIQFNPKLIPELQDEHRTVLDRLGRITQSHAAGNFPETAALLESFGSLLTAHLLKEDFRLYSYLEHSLAGDPKTRAMVRQFREEMDGIGKAALAFLGKYRNIAVLPSLPDDFAAELAELEKILQERISREERTLYPMYLPAY